MAPPAWTPLRPWATRRSSPSRPEPRGASAWRRKRNETVRWHGDLKRVVWSWTVLVFLSMFFCCLFVVYKEMLMLKWHDILKCQTCWCCLKKRLRFSSLEWRFEWTLSTICLHSWLWALSQIGRFFSLALGLFPGRSSGWPVGIDGETNPGGCVLEINTSSWWFRTTMPLFL